MPWIALGTLVVINNDEGDHLQAKSVQSTPFNAPLKWCSAHNARARVGLWVTCGSKSGQQRVFPKLFADHLGRSNKRFQAILSHIGPT